GDDVGGLAGQRFAPLLGQQPDLGGPVHLVAAEVHQADDAGAGGVEHLGEVLLVDLQHAVGRVLVLGEGGDVAGGHVGAERGGGHLPQLQQRGGDQPRRGGLAEIGRAHV